MRRNNAYLIMTCLLFLAGMSGGCSLWSSEKPQPASNTTYLVKSDSPDQAKTATLTSGSAMTLSEQVKSADSDSKSSTRSALRVDNGIIMKDGHNGYIVMPGNDPGAPDPSYANARELRLKMRELASQLLAQLSPSYSGYIAVPTTFVSQENFSDTSAFGRFVSEQMFYELNQRGVRTREYRMNGKLTTNAQGEFVLIRSNTHNKLDDKSLYIVGTYYSNNNNIFINARLITARGDVIRSGQMVMAGNSLTRSMMAGGGKRLNEGCLEIRAANESASGRKLGAFEYGKDIH